MKDDVRESLKHGVNFIDRTCPCPRSDRKVWRVINGKEVEIYNVAIRDSEYTKKQLGRSGQNGQEWSTRSWSWSEWWMEKK